MKVAICNGQDDAPCESADVELNNLLALGNVFLSFYSLDRL